MKLKQFLLFVGALALISACKKTEYSNTSTTTQPTFYFIGTINNAPVNIQAGVNNYIMSTSYDTDLHYVYDYIGVFTTGAVNSPNSLKLYIKDSYPNAAKNEAHIDSLLTTGYYDYSNVSGEPKGYYVNLPYFFNQTDINYSWDFGDGTTQTPPNLLQNPTVHYYNHPGIYNVTMTMYSSSCSSTNTNTVLVGEVGNAFQAPFSNVTYTLTTTQFQVPPTLNGVPPYTYSWDFGDGSTAGNLNPVTHNYASAGVYEVTCTTTDATGYKAVSHFNTITPSATGCAAGFFENTLVAEQNTKNLNDVGISWYDNTGKLWVSLNNNQHIHSLFKVTAVSDYQNNANGQPVKMISAQVACELYNAPYAATDSIALSGTVVFGVAHY